MNELELWKWVASAEGRELVESATQLDLETPAAHARLRKRWTREKVRVAIELVTARRRASAKFERALDLIVDNEGVEQATSARVASSKANRFKALHPDRIIDLCAGIGGDTMGLALVAPVLAVDRDPVRAWMAGQNAGTDSRAARAESWVESGHLVHIDPARRVEAKEQPGQGRLRTWGVRSSDPGLDFLRELANRSRGLAVKLGPGEDFDELPDQEATEIEVIAERGRLVQAVWWHGDLALSPGFRRATDIDSELSLCAQPEPVRTASVDPIHYLLEPHPALERTGLLGTVANPLGLSELAPGLGLLGSAVAVQNPWFRSYQVLAQLPWRLKKISDWLKTQNAGEEIIKTRDAAVPVEPARRELRGEGETTFVIFGLRLGREVKAVITQHQD